MLNIDSPYAKTFLPSSDTQVHLENFTAWWHTEDLDKKTPVLNNINFNIKKGEVVSIIGQIGTGKTSLLFAIMQEIPRYAGTFYSTSSISLVE